MLLDRFDSLFSFLAAYPQYHARDSTFYQFLDGVAKHAFREARPEFEAGRAVPLGEFGPVVLPYEKMGAIDSIDLFGLDELLMFAFYHRNRGKYRRGADIGANIGLHSILLAKCGLQMEAFEPDPVHHAKLVRNVGLNGVSGCTAHMAAVSEKKGKMEFVRVLGNTTSSHLAGAKANPYGKLERFEVDVHDVREIAARADLMKIDAEGHEAVILKALPFESWNHVDAFVEIGSPENACAVFDHFARSGVNIFSQKLCWGRAVRIEDVPSSYKEGGVFVSSKSSMPW